MLPTSCFHNSFVDYFSNFATNGVLSLQICRLFHEFCYQRRAFTLDLPIISRILLPTTCFHYRFFDYFSNFATNDVLSLQICRLCLEFCYQWPTFTLDLSIISRILLPTACFHYRFVDYFSNFATNGVLSLQICRLFLEFCYQRRAFTLDLSIISRIFLPTACFHFRFVDYFSNFATNDVLSLQICRLFLEFYYQRRVSLQICRLFLQFCSQRRVSLQISRLSLEFCYQRRAFTLDLSIISRILLSTTCFHFRFVDYFSNFVTNGVLSLQIYRLFLEFCYQRRAFTLDLSIISRIMLPTSCFHNSFVDYFSNFATNGVLSLQTCRLFLEFCYQWPTFTLDLSIISRILLSTACFHFRFVDYFSNFATNGVLSLLICRLFLEFCQQRRAFTSDLSIISRILLPMPYFHFRFIDYFSNFAINGVLSLQICRLFLEFRYQRRAFTLDLSIISRILLLTAYFHFRFVDYFSNFAINDVLSLQICRLFLEFCYQRRAFTLDLSIISRIFLLTTCFHFRFVDYFSNFTTNGVFHFRFVDHFSNFAPNGVFHFRLVDYLSNFATNGVLSLQFCRLFLEFCYQRRAFTLDLSIISRILLPTTCFHLRFVDYFSNFATNVVLSLQICRLFLEFCYQRRVFTLDLSIISRILLPTACFHFRLVDYFTHFATNGVLSLQVCRLFLEFCYQRRAFTLDLSIISRILLPTACFHFRFIDYFSNFSTNDVLSLQICRLFLEFYYQRRVSLQICRSFLQFCSQQPVSLQISRLSLEFCYQRRAFTLDLSIISRILLSTTCFHFRFANYFSNFVTNVVLSQQICRLFLEFRYQRRAFTLDLSIISRILLPTACFHFRLVDYFTHLATNGVLSLQVCRLFLEFCYQRRAFTLDLSIISRILLPTACFHFRFVDHFSNFAPNSLFHFRLVDYLSNFATNGVLSLQICRLFLEFCSQRRAFTLDLPIISRILLPTSCFHNRFVDYFSNFATNGVLSLQIFSIISRILLPTACFHFRFADYFSNFATNGLLSLQICRLFLEFCYQRRAFTIDFSIISRILLPTACFHFRFVDYFWNFATNDVLSLQIYRLFLEFFYQRHAFTLDLSIISRILLPTACFTLDLSIISPILLPTACFTSDQSIISRILLPTACFHFRFVDYFSNFATNGVLSLQIYRLFLEFFYQRRAFTLDLSIISRILLPTACFTLDLSIISPILLPTACFTSDQSIISRILLPTACFHFRFVDYFWNFATNDVLSLQIYRLFLEFFYQRHAFTLDLSIISRILLPTACFTLDLSIISPILLPTACFTSDQSIISRILLPTACFHFRFVDYFSNFATNGVLSLQIYRLFLEFFYQRRAFTLDLSIISRILLPTACFTLDLSIISPILLPTACFTSDQSIISRILLPTACFHFRSVDYFSNFALNDVLSLQICQLFLEFCYQRRAFTLDLFDYFSNFATNGVLSLQICRLFLEFCYQRPAFTLDLPIISRILLPTTCFHYRFFDYFSNFATNDVLSLQICRLCLEFCYQWPTFTLDLSIISRILLPTACFHYRFVDYFSNFATNGVLSLQICRLFLEFCYQRRAFTLDLSIISGILLPTTCFHFRFVDHFSNFAPNGVFHFRLVDYLSNFATNGVLSLQICRLFLEFCYQRRAFTLICRLLFEFCYQRRAFTLDLFDYFSNFATNGVLSLQICRLFLEFCYQRRAFTLDLPIISRILLPTTCFHYRFFDYFSNFATNDVLSLQICRLCLEFCYQWPTFTLDLSIISRILLPTACFHSRFVDYFSNFATNGVLSLQICRLFLEFCYQRRAFTLDLSIISRIFLPTACFHFRFVDYFSNFATNGVLSLQICRLFLEFCYQRRVFTLDLSIISRILLPTACFHFRLVDYFTHFATNGVLSLQIC